MRRGALLGGSWPAWRHGLLAGMAIAILGAALSAAPFLWPLQESFDLWVLFKLRGPQPPPDDIVLVAIDQQSSERISLPIDRAAHDRCEDLKIGKAPPNHEKLPPPHLVMRWPRCVHALAIRALHSMGAKVIALDISFRPLSAAAPGASARAEDEQDRILGQSIELAGNVVLAQWLDPVETERQGTPDKQNSDSIHRPARISSAVESSALGAAPLRLTWGLAGRINGFAAFSEEEVPMSSMPALIYHLSNVDIHADLIRLLKQASPENADLLPPTPEEFIARRPVQATSLAIRNLVRSEPKIAGGLQQIAGGKRVDVPARQREALRSLAELYTGDAIRYLNFYGPPGTFASVSYADVVKVVAGVPGQSAIELKGKTVIVGYMDFTPAQRDDHYPTVYTTGDGVKLSGSEILATAIANVAARNSLTATPLSLRILVAIGFGFALGIVLLVLPALRGLAAAFALCVAYLGCTVLLFQLEAIWLPVLVPLVAQAPAGILYAAIYHFQDIRRKRDELRRLFGKFVPDPIIAGLLENRAKLGMVNDPVYGVCLATDAERFTALAEKMPPAELARFLNQYFEVVFPPITEQEGTIADIVGDAVLAFWTGRDSDRNLHTKACGAALRLMAAVDQFNAAFPGSRLPTRIGIAAGPVTTAAMGTANRYEFRPVGDTVVMSSRLQELNKQLGTRVLAAEAVVDGADTLLVRDVGVFLLRGKNVPTHVFEILDEREHATANVMQLCLEFALALDAVRSGRRETALERFRAIHDRYPQDGPTAFYVQWLANDLSILSAAIPQR